MNLARIGQILFALPILAFGIMHFPAAGDMAGMVPGWVPGGILWVYLTGVALIAAAVSFLIGKYTVEAGIALAVLLGSFVLTIHLPGVMNPETADMAMPNLLKDVGLMGGALMAGHLGRRESGEA
ncbi:MAG: DoxX family protein [Gemmatimonadales bacterium]|nr:MAG: DoxX family protein [Gemmatimonadales bacterium]